MNLTKMKQMRFGLALLTAAAVIPIVPAQAQVRSGAYREDAGTALTRHLKTLSEQPRSIAALTGAGKAALELGDPQAALTFFARAEEIAPRDGRVKAGMASAFLAMEQPEPAMRFFSEAASLGVPAAEFGGDRGLAYDLAGDQGRAQADYQLALGRQENPETRRRLALSLAISGERDRALATIDAQLRNQDRAAWRTRAFILALSGDAAGATSVAQSMMPAQAAQLSPFFARLPALSPAQQAMAVHFGHFPGGGQALQTAANNRYAAVAPAPGSQARAGQPDGAQAPLGRNKTQTPRREERQRHNPWAAGRGRLARTVTTNPVTPPRPSSQAPAQQSASARRALPVQQQRVAPPAAAPSAAVSTGIQVAQTAPVVQQSAPVSMAPSRQVSFASTPPVGGTAAGVQNPAVSGPAGSLPTAVQSSSAETPAARIETVELPAANLANVGSAAANPAPPTTAPAEADPEPSFADIAASIAALPEEPAPKPARGPALAQLDVRSPAADKPKAAAVKSPPPKPAAKKADSPKENEPAKKQTAAKKDEPAKKVAAKKAEPAEKEPSRHWVQIAGGADEKAMDDEFKRLKAKAPKLLGSRTAWTTPLRATNRLLVGPFKTPEEAQDFVNELAELKLSAFSWTSPKGQEIVKLSVK